MVTTYKRKTDRVLIDEKAVQKAIKQIKEDKISVRRAAFNNGIHYNTLQYRLKKLESNTPPRDPKQSKYSVWQVFSPDQEIELVSYILKCSKLHFGLTLKQVRSLAFEYAKKLGLKYPKTWETNQQAG